MEHRNDSEALGPYFEQLRYDHPVGRCHVCVGRRKLTAVALEPPKPHDGLQWYFHAPFELSFESKCYMPFQNPLRWCNPNRDTSFDPCLVDVLEAYKDRALSNLTRHVRPPEWENALRLNVVLADAHEKKVVTNINLFCFCMNPQWRSHAIVKYLEDWVPHNLDYVGPVLKPQMRPSFPDTPPSPPSPWGTAVDFESSVTIEELPPAVDEEWERLKAQAREEESDTEQEFEEFRAMRASRRRTNFDWANEL